MYVCMYVLYIQMNWITDWLNREIFVVRRVVNWTFDFKFLKHWKMWCWNHYSQAKQGEATQGKALPGCPLVSGNWNLSFPASYHVDLFPLCINVFSGRKGMDEIMLLADVMKLWWGEVTSSISQLVLWTNFCLHAELKQTLLSCVRPSTTHNIHLSWVLYVRTVQCCTCTKSFLRKPPEWHKIR